MKRVISKGRDISECRDETVPGSHVKNSPQDVLDNGAR